MSRLSYETADTLIYDPVAANRTATRSLLYQLGFRRIDTVGDLEALDDVIKCRPPDLALCEAQGPEDELCRTIQNLRQGATGYNPFIVVIVTAWEKTTAMVDAVLNSGADDFVLRPFSTASIGRRIISHIERRKGFVITTDYVGPDRRNFVNCPSDIDRFDPPNSLKMKVKEGLGIEELNVKLETSLKAAREKLMIEKLRRDAFQICVLWRLTQDCKMGVSKYEVDLTKLRDLAKSVARRCAHGDFEHAVEWCDGILSAIETLGKGVDSANAMHMLGHAALNLNQAFTPDKSSTDHLAAIDATVAMIRARDLPAMAS